MEIVNKKRLMASSNYLWATTWICLFVAVFATWLSGNLQAGWVDQFGTFCYGFAAFSILEAFFGGRLRSKYSGKNLMGDYYISKRAMPWAICSAASVIWIVAFASTPGLLHSNAAIVATWALLCTNLVLASMMLSSARSDFKSDIEQAKADYAAAFEPAAAEAAPQAKPSAMRRTLYYVSLAAMVAFLVCLGITSQSGGMMVGATVMYALALVAALAMFNLLPTKHLPKAFIEKDSPISNPLLDVILIAGIAVASALEENVMTATGISILAFAAADLLLWAVMWVERRHDTHRQA